jgi:hypothetical protein
MVVMSGWCHVASTSRLAPKLRMRLSANYVHSVIGASVVVCIYQRPALPAK